MLVFNAEMYNYFKKEKRFRGLQTEGERIRAQYQRPCRPMPRLIVQHLAGQVFQIQILSFTDKAAEPKEIF